MLLFFQRLFQRLLFQRFGFLEVLFKNGEQHRVEHDRQNCARQHQILAFLRQQIECHTEASQNKREFTNLRQAGGNG